MLLFVTGEVLNPLSELLAVDNVGAKSPLGCVE
jgi:hypothetical protein